MIDPNIYINDTRYNVLFVDQHDNIREEGKMLAKTLSVLNLAVSSVIISTEMDHIEESIKLKYKFIHIKLKENLYCKSIATGVIVSAQEMLRRDKNTDPLSNRKFLLHGFGNIGAELAKIIKDRAIIVAISTDEGTIKNKNGLDIYRLLELYEKYDDKMILEYGNILPKNEIYSTPCDIFIAIDKIKSDKIIDVRPIIIPATFTAYKENVLINLEKNGLTCFPEIVSVSGPVIAKLSQLIGCDNEEIILEITKEVIRSVSRDLIRAGRACGVRKSLRKVADERAEGNNSLHIEYLADNLEVIDIVEDFIREYALGHYLR